MNSVDVYLRRGLRNWRTGAAVVGAILVVACLILLLAGARPGIPFVVLLLFNVVTVVQNGLRVFRDWRQPLLRLGPDDIVWRLPGTKRAQRMAVAGVTGFRWPMPKDLWIEGAGGETLQIPMIGVSPADRDRVRAWLGERWVDGGFR